MRTRSRTGRSQQLCCGASDVDHDVNDPDYWEKLLASEGMPADPRRKLMRDTVRDADGLRRWRGLRTIPIEALDDWMAAEAPDDTAQLMRAPHEPMGTYTTAQREKLREALLDAMERLLSPRELEVLFATVLGSEPYEAVARRMGLPKSTCYLAAQRGLQKLRDGLDDVPEVVAYLARHSITDEDR